MKWMYAVAAVAGCVLAISCKFFLVHSENLKLRSDSFRAQQSVEALQSKVLLLKQQLDTQQIKLQKSAAIINQVGPALIDDIQNVSQKSGNLKLKLLLREKGFELLPIENRNGIN